ncbi:MAG: type II toxin-antitoxin system HicA family toxin [Ignavibacteriales bacterium]|nr:type II toxin-antitoxin system HicA family toxin [Ignavibacteriales bacterium]
MKVREIIRLLENDGWYLVRQKGSHKQFRHSVKKGLVTVSHHRMSDEMAPGTLNSILKQAQMKG